MRIAVIVNDMGEVNIDAQLVANEGHLDQTDEQLVELSNGCICCTLREDLLIEVEKLVNKGGIDYIVIESTGISEPIPVAQTFSYIDEEMNIDLTKICHLDTMVTVIDANRFLHDFQSGEKLLDRKQAVSDSDIREIADLLIDQIEFCDVLILNKTDLVSKSDLNKLEKVLRSLQPEALFIKTVNAEVDPSLILNTHRFDFEKVADSAGWIQELTAGHHNHTPETEEYGVTSFVYHRKLPFHPQRFADWMNTMHSSIVSAKGIVWLANYNTIACLFSQAGPSIDVKPITFWVDAMSDTQKNEILTARPEVVEEWDPEYGDRHTKFVIIGIDLDEDAITKSLDECLLKIDEIDADWSKFQGPFTWNIRNPY